MTREQAINHLKTVAKSAIDSGYDSAVVDAVGMAREALEQEPCGDVISRDELLKAIDTWDKFGCDANTKLVPYQDHYIPYIHYDDVVRCIKGMPPVTPQPKTGHWEWVQYDYNPKLGNWHCSECRCVVVECVDKNEKGGIPLYKYCPQCGTKMEDKK